MRRVGRNREKFKRWPKGWEQGTVRKDGTFDIYFRPTNAGDQAIVKAITGEALYLKLGATEDEASTTYAERIVAARTEDEEAEPGTVAEIVRMGRLEFLPSIKNEKTRGERARHLQALLKKFGKRRYARNVYEASMDTRGIFLRAMDVQRHIFDGKNARHVGVNREVRSWELLFQWARAPWGLTEYNPCSGLIMNDETHRKVVPQDGSIFKLYRELDPPARFMVGMIRYYGRRKVELLGLELGDVKHEDGVHMRRGKDAESKPIIHTWDDRLRKMVARVLRWRAQVLRPILEEKVRNIERKLPTALLLNRLGRPCTVSGFNSARTRAMKRAGMRGEFTFHDIRKQRADTLTAAEATNVLAHDDPRTTNVKYRVGSIVIDLNKEVNARKKAK